MLSEHIENFWCYISSINRDSLSRISYSNPEVAWTFNEKQTNY